LFVLSEEGGGEVLEGNGGDGDRFFLSSEDDVAIDRRFDLTVKYP
jgi:hypothetical protein